MSKIEQLFVRDLNLDLRNFRTVPQQDEVKAIHAMIAINSDWFWALIDSLIVDGYLPTENIIILKDGKKLIVREGNRRIAALKLIHGYIDRTEFSIPEDLNAAINGLPQSWFTENSHVPCTVYEVSESAKVDRIVTLTHGKGEKAGRDKWEAVARARHNRDVLGASEPVLDLLEKYLKNGDNITPSQRERWSGVYPFSVLDEAAKKIAPRFQLNSREMADIYPKIKEKASVETILLDIGLGKITFETMRHQASLDGYGLPTLPTIPSVSPRLPSTALPGNVTNSSVTASASSPSVSTPSVSSSAVLSPLSPSVVASAGRRQAVPLDSARSVMRILKTFKPVGRNRDKVVSLRDEAVQLKMDKNPLAFCFLLRSMFEISAKAYCSDHTASGGPKVIGSDGRDRPLVDVLNEISGHLKKNNTSQQFQKELHGATTEIGKPAGLLSVVSMNQLVHNPKFTTNETNICGVFHSIFPLLEAMNR